MERFSFAFSLALHLVIATAFFAPSSWLAPSLSPISIEVRSGSDRHPSPDAKKKVTVFKTDTKTETATEAATEADSVPISGTKLGLQVDYPRLSRVLGEEGQVLIGLGREASVISSSGHPRLDEAALAAVRGGMATGRLSQQLENQKDLRISFVFRLTKAAESPRF